MISYSEFEVLFKNVDITESDFNIYEPYAEDLARAYVGEVLPPSYKNKYAIGLIIQNLVAIGIQPNDKIVSQSEGGVSIKYRDLEVIPEEAKKILDRCFIT